MATIWVTNSDLGSVPEGQYYNLNLETYDTSGFVSYTLIAGQLPGNLSLLSDGNIYGNLAYVNSAVTSNFTIRATNANAAVTDRTFSLKVISPTPPNITPPGGMLTSSLDGAYYEQQFSLTDPALVYNTTFVIHSGTIPSGLSLTTAGLLSGYIEPIAASEEFDFTIRAYDGNKLDQKDYTVAVYKRNALTADTSYYTTDNVSIITADQTSKFLPFLLDSGSIGNVVQGDNFAYKLQGVDYNNSGVTYEITSGSLPEGFSLEPTTGWITGSAPTGNLASVTSSFTAKVYETATPSLASSENSYNLTVLGEVVEEIVWLTDTQIGSIYNGEISDLSINATTTNGRILVYTVVTNVTYEPMEFEIDPALNYGLLSYGAMPPGLQLLNDGTISGRPSFDIRDDRVTYVFTVAASDPQGMIYGEKEFVITVVKRDHRPYENLYLTVMPNRESREYYSSVLNNTDIIPPGYLYRPIDPWFGKNTLRRVLFETGLNPELISDYVEAIQKNHYWKKLNFGNLKTAIAKDENFDPIYEVVYLELIDEQVNDQGAGPSKNVTWPVNDAGVSTVYPNSFPNMLDRLATGIGYQDRSILPKWMTTRQPDGTILGFTRALVLCYTIPGYGSEVAYRLADAITRFNLIDFTVDRYEYDTILSDYFIKTPVTGTGDITANTVSQIVVGNSTIFSNELQIGSMLYVGNVVVGNVANISSDTTLTLDANASSNISSASYTYSNSFVVVNYTQGTGNISTSIASNVVTGNTANITGTGTISGISGNNEIIGTSTLFNTELQIGSDIFVTGNSIGKIGSIVSPTKLILVSPLSLNLTASAFESQGKYTRFTTELYVGDVLVDSGNTIIGTVSTISNNTSLTLTTNAAIALSSSTFSHTVRDPYTTPGQGDKYIKFPKFGVL